MLYFSKVISKKPWIWHERHHWVWHDIRCASLAFLYISYRNQSLSALVLLLYIFLHARYCFCGWHKYRETHHYHQQFGQRATTNQRIERRICARERLFKCFASDTMIQQRCPLGSTQHTRSLSCLLVFVFVRSRSRAAVGQHSRRGSASSKSATTTGSNASASANTSVAVKVGLNMNMCRLCLAEGSTSSRLQPVYYSKDTPNESLLQKILDLTTIQVNILQCTMFLAICYWCMH